MTTSQKDAAARAIRKQAADVLVRASLSFKFPLIEKLPSGEAQTIPRELFDDMVECLRALASTGDAATKPSADLLAELLAELRALPDLEGFGCACEPLKECSTCRARGVLRITVAPVVEKYEARAALAEAPVPVAP